MRRFILTLMLGTVFVCVLAIVFVLIGIDVSRLTVWAGLFGFVVFVIADEMVRRYIK